MTKFLNTSKAYAEIEDIVNKANNRVVLISPYIKIPELLLARLKYIGGKGIKIVVVCRKGDLKADVRSDLSQLKNLELRFDENLHAKCFYNEESMVIGSLNLYDYSQHNNREMGILLSLKDDYNVFNEARNEAEFIVSNAEKDGFCINCRTSIPYNLEKPLCSDCFSEWSPFGDPEYELCFCHSCSKAYPATIEKPLCSSCYYWVAR